MSELPLRNRVTALLRNGKWSRWISRGTWTLIDRGLFALSNFTLNIALARWMSVEDYGAFAVAFSIFMMLSAVYSSFLIGPLLVFGARRYSDRLETYLGLLIKGHLAFSIPISASLALIGGGFLLWQGPEVGLVCLALALSGPFILLLWLTRRSCYVRLQPKRAAAGGAVYMVLLLAGTYLLRDLAILTPATALFLMAIASLVVAIWLAIRQQARLFDESLLGAFAREIALEHWRYGRWTFPAHFLADAKTNLFFLVLPIWGGLEATAALRAMMNLIMPISFTLNSLSMITVPAFVRARTSGTLHEKIMLATGFFMASSLIYGATLVMFEDSIIELLYADRYGSYGNLIWLLALLPVVNSVGMISSSVLNAMERPKETFLPAVVGFGCAATVGLGITAIAGTLGAAIGLLLSACATSALLVWRQRSAAWPA